MLKSALITRRLYSTVKPGSGITPELEFLQNILVKVEAKHGSSKEKKLQQKQNRNANGNGKFANNRQNVKKPFKQHRRDNVRPNADGTFPQNANNSNRSRKRVENYSPGAEVIDVLDSAKGPQAGKTNRTSSTGSKNKRVPRNQGTRNSSIRVFRKPNVGLGQETQAPAEYSPSNLSPENLLKYSSLVPVNKNLRVLNGTVGLLRSKNSNIDFLNNDSFLSNFGNVLGYQALFNNNGLKSYIPNPQIKLDSNVSASVSDFTEHNLKNNPPLKELKLFANVVRQSGSVSEEDIQKFKSIVNGDFQSIDKDTKVLSKQSAKLIRNFDIVKRSLNNNVTLDFGSKLKAFEPCVGIKSIKELVHN